MSTTIQVKCSNGFTLKACDQILSIVTKREEESIPVSAIQAFSLKEPRGLSMGKITFRTAQAASASVNVGLGIGLAFGAEKSFFFASSEAENAHALRDFVNSGGDAPKPAVAASEFTEAEVLKGKMVVSVVDEIRGLKGLLDDGILSQEEFDAKKKQLLGI